MDGAVFCVSSIDQSRLRNAAEKEILNRQGLGLKTIKLCITWREEEFLSAIVTEFGPLKYSRGFELLRMDSGRSVRVIQAPWTSSNLKTNIGSQACNYVRPIQFDISAPAIAPECETSGLKKGNPSYRTLVKIVVGKRLINKVQYYLILTRHMVWRYTPCYQ